MFNAAYRVAGAALALACPCIPAMAGPSPDPHHDSIERITLDSWVDRIQAELADQLDSQSLSSVGGTQTGVVRIKFNCSEDGHADKVAVARSSGSRGLDLAAVRAVKRIAAMHPLATGINTDQLYYADILFSPMDSREVQRKIAQLRKDARTANGWYKAPPETVIASR